MSGPQGRREMAELLDRHGVAPRRRLGQHFLADPNIVRKVVAVAGVQHGDLVVEVGAGTGTLTRALGEAGCRVRAYEVDEGLRPVLAEAVGHLPDVEVRFADALAALPDELEGGPWVLVANLPYNVGTPLLLKLLRSGPQVQRFVVMVQKEVADRLAAPAGSRTYGLPSVVVALYADIRREFTVPPQVFFPPPQIESAVVTLSRREAPALSERALKLAAAAFGQRRKMLRRSLAGTLADPERVLIAAGIDAKLRAEQLQPDDYVALAREEQQIGG